jgi:hypothetical protein
MIVPLESIYKVIGKYLDNKQVKNFDLEAYVPGLNISTKQQLAFHFHNR